jgi:hypothetical protein
MNSIILAAVISVNTTMSIINVDFSTLSNAEISDFRADCKVRGLPTMETHARDGKIYSMRCWSNDTTGFPS